MTEPMRSACVGLWTTMPRKQSQIRAWWKIRLEVANLRVPIPTDQFQVRSEYTITSVTSLLGWRAGLTIQVEWVHLAPTTLAERGRGWYYRKQSTQRGGFFGQTGGLSDFYLLRQINEVLWQGHIWRDISITLTLSDVCSWACCATRTIC